MIGRRKVRSELETFGLAEGADGGGVLVLGVDGEVEAADKSVAGEFLFKNYIASGNEAIGSVHISVSFRAEFNEVVHFIPRAVKEVSS